MSIVRKTGGLVKSGLKKAGHGSVVIGGMNAEEMSSKKDLIQDLINEAKVRAESEINDIKEQAQIEANQILEQAKAEVETIENQAYLKGYEAGKQEAITRTEEEYH